MKRFIMIMSLFCMCLAFFQCDSKEPLQGNSIEQVVQSDEFQFEQDVPRLNVSPSTNQSFAVLASFNETEDTSTAEAQNEDVGWMQWIRNNWGVLTTLLISLLGVAELIVRLTPTDKDNARLRWVKNILSFIVPNKKTGGGTHS